MPPTGHNLRGFTLIELVLVLSIIALCAAIAVPSLGGFTRGRALPNAAASLVGTTRWCRVKAISEGLAYRLNFDAHAGKWWVTKDDGTTGLNFVPVDDELAREFTLAEGIVLTANIAPIENATYITFDPAGRSDVTAIRLQSGDNYIDIANDTPLGTYHVVIGGRQ